MRSSYSYRTLHSSPKYAYIASIHVNIIEFNLFLLKYGLFGLRVQRSIKAGESCIMGRFMTCTLQQIKEDEVEGGGACGRCGGEY
jgi:hypothetical protein